MSTPTVGSLRRRLERIEQERRQDVTQDIADLEARVEDIEERMGLSDGADPYEDNVASVGDVDTVEMHFGKEQSWEATHLRGSRAGIMAYVDSEGDYWVTTHNILKDGANGMCVLHPDDLRSLADKIEEAER